VNGFDSAPRASRRGSPLAMLLLLIGVWIGGRAILWENPFPAAAWQMPIAESLFAGAGHSGPDGAVESLASNERSEGRGDIAQGPIRASFASTSPSDRSLERLSLTPAAFGVGQRYQTSPSNEGLTPPIVAAGHQFLMSVAFRIDWNTEPRAPARTLIASGTPLDAFTIARLDGFGKGRAGTERGQARRQVSFQNNFASAFAGSSSYNQRTATHTGTRRSRSATSQTPATDRWSLDAFAFYRSGSGSAQIAQGRVPVYGASQMAANLQYRVLPSSRHDPRLYARGYRAFTGNPENEVAVGASARPLATVPVRVAGEARVLNNASGTQVRPAAYAVTELRPQALPLGTQLEFYGGAGYVGGNAPTPFAEGQATVTRELAQFTRDDGESARLRIGAGAWGGAQEGASRVDVGPTVRLDIRVADVPARLSLDWRERVAGDAAPTSGLAATLSTRF